MAVALGARLAHLRVGREERIQNSAYGSLRRFLLIRARRPSAARAMMMKRQGWFARPGAPLAAVGILVGLATMSAQQPGQSRPRPAEGREPELPPPTIREYKPRSTLVVPQHPVPKAKFPAIDIHGHPPSPTNAADYQLLVKSMDALNLQLMVYAGNNNSSERVPPMIAAIKNSPYPDRMAVFTNLSFREAVGPGSGKRMAAQLEADVKAGAKGLGEIMKG